VWLPEEVRDAFLVKARERADQGSKQYPEPFVFEGSAPADVRENIVLRAQLQAKSVKPPAQARIWLGAPNSIKGPTDAVFQRQSGSNLFDCGSKRGNVLDTHSRRAGVAGRAISQGHRAFSPAGQHAARISATRISGARHPGHSARNRPGKIRRPGEHDGRFGSGN